MDLVHEIELIKSLLREEYQYNKDIAKINNSTFLTKRIRAKKISFTKNKLRKIVVKKEDIINDLQAAAYKEFSEIAGTKAMLINNLSGTEKIIEKMNVRLELMRTGQDMLKKTKTSILGSYDVDMVDYVIESMERKFIKKYEQLIKAF